MPQDDILTTPGQKKERFYPLTVQPSPEMSLTGWPSNTATLLNQSLARICSLPDYHCLGHGYTSGARGEVLLPESRAIDAEQEKILSVTLCSLIHVFIHSFILQSELGTCFMLETRYKILDNFYLSFLMQLKNHQFCDKFLHCHPLSRVRYSPLMLLFLSKYLSNTFRTVLLLIFLPNLLWAPRG